MESIPNLSNLLKVKTVIWEALCNTVEVRKPLII